MINDIKLSTIFTEFVKKDLTVFEANTQTVTYQFEIKNADMTPTSCYILASKDGQPDQARQHVDSYLPMINEKCMINHII